MLDRVIGDRPKPQGVGDAALDLIDAEGLKEPQHLDIFALAVPAHPRFGETAERRKAFRQIPALRKRRPDPTCS